MGVFLLLLGLLLFGTARNVTAGRSAFTGSGPADFMAWLGPIAQDSQRRTGIPASVVIAQAAVESGWGKSRLLRETGNAFGVKAGRSWRSRVISATTKEEYGGIMQTFVGTWKQYPTKEAALKDGAHPVTIFRVYPSTAESVKDHARVLYNGLYDHAMPFRGNGIAFARAIARPYATDSKYADLLESVIRGRNLTSLDVPAAAWALDPGVVPPKWRA